MSTDCLPDLHLRANCGYPACGGTIRTNNPRFYRRHRHQMETILRIYIYAPDAIHTTQAKRTRGTYRENKASFKSLHTTRSIATPQFNTLTDADSRHVECCHPATVYYVYPPTYHECSVHMQGGGGADNTSNPHIRFRFTEEMPPIIGLSL
ncbi:hypothetical protein BDV33DRAFT_175785 [Aspergillus novoparasiticus]|uniref:Uncharacterized protein n=1 Tax=Aspergillus novoparasiticus TaxID=986946 RepID=A0A5N6EKR1_9EURO|nr:hypothetical protein BDV33DRAFT_175785 [Aspergillus novoparasiticus]